MRLINPTYFLVSVLFSQGQSRETFIHKKRWFPCNSGLTSPPTLQQLFKILILTFTLKYFLKIFVAPLFTNFSIQWYYNHMIQSKFPSQCVYILTLSNSSTAESYQPYLCVCQFKIKVNKVWKVEILNTVKRKHKILHSQKQNK